MKILTSKRAEPEQFSASGFHIDYSTSQLLTAGRVPKKVARFRCFFKLDKASS
jgi:hypothetical protein